MAVTTVVCGCCAVDTYLRWSVGRHSLTLQAPSGSKGLQLTLRPAGGAGGRPCVLWESVANAAAGTRTALDASRLHASDFVRGKGSALDLIRMLWLERPSVMLVPRETEFSTLFYRNALLTDH